MKISPPFSLLLVISFFLLFVQCEQDNYSFIESQKEELLNEFLDLSLNNNPLYDLYDAKELTILECEKIIQELNQGKALITILPTYLSKAVDVQQVYEFFSQTTSLTKELRRYNVTESEMKEKIEHYPIIKSRHRTDLKEPILTRSIFGSLNYNRCKRYCEDDYDACVDQAIRSGATTYGIIMLGGIGSAPFTGGASIFVAGFFVGPLSGYMQYANNRNYCKETLETCLIRCEEEK